MMMLECDSDSHGSFDVIVVDTLHARDTKIPQRDCSNDSITTAQIK